MIAKLQLSPHPEGGWYREVYRSSRRVLGEQGTRCALTTIYYLLERDQVSRWHVVDADEAWHFHAGAPMELFAYDPASRALLRRVLSGGIATGASRASRGADRLSEATAVRFPSTDSIIDRGCDT